MSIGLIGTKIGMTREFMKSGQSVPVTVIKVEKGRVLDVITKEKRGYSAVKVGFFKLKNSKLTKQMKGYFAKKNTEPKKILKEFRVENNDQFKEGNELGLEIFKDKKFIDVRSKTIGKGFAGGMKRWNFSGLRASHGVSVSHRAHASTSSITHYLPSVAGLLLQEELGTLENLLRQPKSPISGLVGGAKISTKLELLKNLTKNLDHLVIGGGMANTFLLAQGKNVGKSLCEPEMIDTAKVILADAQKESEIMKGEGDGARNKIFADAFGQDPEFFAFYRAMQAYEKALIGGETSLILSPDSEFFKFFGNIKPEINQ